MTPSSCSSSRLLEALDGAELERESLALFRALLRLDTTNPPGNEHLACALLAERLREDGIEPFLVERSPGRANLVARLPANRPIERGPLLLAGHTDVVPARAEAWTHDPFSAQLEEGMIWGRGALDMKNMVAMSAMTIKLFARHPEIGRHRDLIFAAVADEEEGCLHGSTYLVEEHPERVRAEEMLGEVGGFWLTLGEQTFVPIMVAEKGRAHLKLSARGEPGHASIPREDNALMRLARALSRLDERGLPYRLTPVVEDLLSELAARQPTANRLGLEALKRERWHNLVLSPLLMPERDKARAFYAMLHNTASPTIARAGSKLNLLPELAECELDARILPGSSLEELLGEVSAALGDEAIAVEVLSSSPPVSLTGYRDACFEQLSAAIKRHAPEAHPVPFLVTGFTDAKAFSRLGTRCYGFSPLKLEARHGLNFSELFHGIDERVPVEGYAWGQRVLIDAVESLLKGAEVRR